MKVATIDVPDTGEQAIRIPNEMRINDDKVYLKQIGNSIHLIPYHNAWQNLMEGVDSFTSDFMESRNQPGMQPRESLD